MLSLSPFQKKRNKINIQLSAIERVETFVSFYSLHGLDLFVSDSKRWSWHKQRSSCCFPFIRSLRDNNPLWNAMKMSWHIPLSSMVYMWHSFDTAHTHTHTCHFLSLLFPRKKKNIIWICVLHFFSFFSFMSLLIVFYIQNSTCRTSRVAHNDKFGLFSFHAVCSSNSVDLSTKIPRDFLHLFSRFQWKLVLKILFIFVNIKIYKRISATTKRKRRRFESIEKAA